MDISEYKESLATLEKIYSYLPQQEKEDNVTILSILDKRFDEDTISDYLAYILDPALNGIGTDPLKKFLQCVDDKWQDEFEEMIDQISITREYSFDNGRRIDLLIQIGDRLVAGVEHKLLSQEHHNQTCDYKKQIQGEFPDYDHVFILLSHDGRRALAQEFQSMSYEDLVRVLKQVHFNSLRNIKKTVFYQDFITHLEENFMKDNTYTISEETRLYLEHAQMINDLYRGLEKDYKNLLSFIMDYLKNLFESETMENGILILRRKDAIIRSSRITGIRKKTYLSIMSCT